MNKRIVVFGITMASGGIENLMHYFLLDCAKNHRFEEITVVSAYPQIVFEDEYKSIGINVVHIPARNKKDAYKKSIQSIIETLMQDDLVYVNLSTYCNWILLSLLSKAKCKIVIHGHNSHVKNPIKKILHFVGKKKYKKIGFKIAVSEECSKFMFDNNHDAIISNGIDSNKFQFDFDNRLKVRSQLSISHNAMVIGCIGRISEEKNQLYLAKLSNRYPDLVFLFLGDFMNDRYRKKVLSLAHSNCIFAGSKTNVECYLSAMDVVAIPSKHEAFPLVAAESLTNGLPIFCCSELKGKIPLSISDNKKCFFIKNDLFNIDVIELSHRCRNNGIVPKNIEYDIKIFLSDLLNFLNSEVLYDC